MPISARHYNLAAIGSFIALLFLCLGWELWWAPLRPGGSWLALKALPLLAPLRGTLHAKRYTHQWLTLLALAYFVEGVVRSTTEVGVSGWLALAETALACVMFAAAVLFIRTARRTA